jgi:hypothetical protein
MRKFVVKPLILLSIFAFTLLVNSCNKSNDIHEADLIGTWNIGQASVDIKVGPLSLIKFLQTALQLSDQEAQDYMEELISEFDYISGGTITFNADYTYQMLNGDFAEQGTWELDGDKLYLTITGEVLEDEHLSIESMDGSSALMAMEEDQEVDLDEDGSTDFTATIIVEVNLSKQ